MLVGLAGTGAGCLLLVLLVLLVLVVVLVASVGIGARCSVVLLVLLVGLVLENSILGDSVVMLTEDRCRTNCYLVYPSRNLSSKRQRGKYHHLQLRSYVW